MNIEPPDSNTGASNENSLPIFFASGNQSTFYYRVTYTVRNITRSIQYNSVHELILSIYCFKDEDIIVYTLRDDGSDYIKITVDEFKISLSSTLYATTSQHTDPLETLYLRLLLTNHHSRYIPDRGRFRQFDFTLRKYMTTMRGGIDCYINHQTALFIKYRRLSNIHLLAKIAEWHDQNPGDIHMTYINIPRSISNPLFEEVLKLHFRKNQFRIYYYDPIPEAENDKIIPNEPTIQSAIIKVINQLIK